MTAAFDEYAKHAREHATSILDGIANEAKAAGVQFETLQVIQDHPYEAIVATAKEKGCDLIVMASHGRSGLAAVLLALQVIEKEWCPGADCRNRARSSS